ncbi:MAG TPA: hypothetical protein VF507_01345, partial [Pyrinomonadaceae bacterium]
SPGVDPLINRFYYETVGPYWPPERVIVEGRYRTIPFPFKELDPPPFRMKASWSLYDLAGYLGTWSATRRFVAARGFDPVPELAEEILALWGRAEEEREVSWSLHMRVGSRAGV